MLNYKHQTLIHLAVLLTLAISNFIVIQKQQNIKAAIVDSIDMMLAYCIGVLFVILIRWTFNKIRNDNKKTNR